MEWQTEQVNKFNLENMLQQNQGSKSIKFWIPTSSETSLDELHAVKSWPTFQTEVDTVNFQTRYAIIQVEEMVLYVTQFRL